MAACCQLFTDSIGATLLREGWFSVASGWDSYVGGASDCFFGPTPLLPQVVARIVL
jgi:hypothetical protein